MSGSIHSCGRVDGVTRVRSRELTGDGRRVSLERAEMDAIADAVTHHGGNLTRIAGELGVSKSTLYANIKKHALQPIIEQARSA